MLERLHLPSLLCVRMETDRIRMKMDSDISDIYFFGFFFQFPFPKTETDQIRMETDSDILDIHFSVFLPFPYLIMCSYGCDWILV